MVCLSNREYAHIHDDVAVLTVMGTAARIRELSQIEKPRARLEPSPDPTEAIRELKKTESKETLPTATALGVDTAVKLPPADVRGRESSLRPTEQPAPSAETPPPRFILDALNQANAAPSDPTTPRPPPIQLTAPASEGRRSLSPRHEEVPSPGRRSTQSVVSADAARPMRMDPRARRRSGRSSRLRRRFRPCSVLHVPYGLARAPFANMRVLQCSECGKGWVPEVILATVEAPRNVFSRGAGYLVESRVSRIRER